MDGTTPPSTRHQITGRHAGIVIDVYDGGTCRVAIAIPPGTAGKTPPFEYHNVRMLGYDVSEMKKEPRPFDYVVEKVFRALVLDKAVVLDIPVPKGPDPNGWVLAHMYTLEPSAPRGGAACWYPPRPLKVTIETRTDATPGFRRATFENRGEEADAPRGSVVDDAPLPNLIHVNQWMIDHVLLEENGGKATRGEWTVEKLENGV